MNHELEYRLAGSAAAAGMLGWAAWRYGLFFDAHAYPVEMIVFAAAALLAVALAGRRRWAGPYAWPAVLFPLGMAACYGIALLLGPVSYKGTVDSMLRWIAFAGWIAGLAVWWRKSDNRAWGEAAIQAVGVLMLAGGWLGWFGWLSFPDIVLRFNDPQLSATGARLAGFLQYPNTFGAAMAFFLVRQWQLWAAEGRKPENGRSFMRPMAAALACLTSVPYAGALLLTESRGSMAALLCGFGLALAFAGSWAVRVRLMMAAVFTAAGAMFAARGGLLGMEGSPFGGWLTAAAMVVGAGVLFGFRLWLARTHRERESQQVGKGRERRSPSGEGQGKVWQRIPYVQQLAVCVVAILAVGWGYIAIGGLGSEGRISGNYGTAASRVLFYRDGFSMFRDSPWTGFGGDSWRSLFGLYQTQPYVGGEVHSGYLEILLDTGLAGFAVFAAMLIYWIWKFWRMRCQALAPAAVLLVHAAMDFDLSFAWVWMLLFAWFVLFTAGEAEVKPVAKQPPVWGRATAALLIGASVWGIWAAWHANAAARTLAAAAEAAASPAREAELRAALEANPAWTRIRLALAPLLRDAGERESVLAAGLRYEPQSAPLMLRLGLAEAELGRVAQAELRLREALRLERYSRDGQTAAIAAMARLAEAKRFGGQAEEARQAAEAAVSFYQTYDRLVREVQAMRNPANGRRFAMNPAAQFNAAKACVLLGRQEEARFLLKLLIDGADTDWAEQAKQLLAQLNNAS